MINVATSTDTLPDHQALAGDDLPLERRCITDLLAERSQSTPDRPFLVFGDEVLTYGSVERASANMAVNLRRLGVAWGDYVGVFLPNCSDFITSYFALSRIGAISVTINTAYLGFILEYVLNDTRCSVMVIDQPLVERIAASEERLTNLHTLYVRGADIDAVATLQTSFARIAVRPFAALLEEHTSAQTSEHPRTTFRDVNCVIYTSGTTGSSKGVPITNAHAIAKAIEVMRICSITPDDVIYSPLPLFHSMALLRGVLAALVARCTCALRERFTASGYWAEVRALRATVGWCVFSIPQILKKAPPSPDDRNHTLRCLYNARYDPEFEARFGVRLVEGYGLTEAGVAMYMRPDDPPNPGSCGRVSDEWEVRLVDEDDRDVPSGTVGEIVLRPRKPHLMMTGYLNRPDATAAMFRNLWFHTGDLALQDAEGFFYFQDRKKDAIRRRGENISSWELEQVLLEHDAIEEAAVLPYPSPVGEDDVRVVVALTQGASLSATELIDYCTRRMPDFMVPRYVEFMDRLPRTPTGRVEKYVLRERGLADNTYDRGDQRAASAARTSGG
jgi:crotonobetaine/carnitine-CoA ligase